MMKPIMLGCWGLGVAFFHGWALALFWDWNKYRCGALFACALAWLIAAAVLTIVWTDRQIERRLRREAQEEKERRR